jgi:hypothetical protein
LIFDSDTTDIQDFNAIHSNLIFNTELEHNNTINFLDTTIQRAQDVRISIFRKPTFTDPIIPYTSNHPPQHKYAAVRFLYNRLYTYQLQEEEYRQEENIHNILHNNSFPIRTSKNTAHRPKHTTPPSIQNQKWVTLYTSKKTTYITSLFKHTNLKIAFCTNNTLLTHLTNREHTHEDKYETCSKVNK